MSRLISIGLIKQLTLPNLRETTTNFWLQNEKNTLSPESVWINKTLSKVRLDSDNDNGCVYSMICDVKQALLKDPSLSGGWYSFFFNKTKFLCSHQMIHSLQFDFVKKMSVGVETNLPWDFIKSVQNDALHATTSHIRSIQLWRSIAIDFS